MATERTSCPIGGDYSAGGSFVRGWSRLYRSTIPTQANARLEWDTRLFSGAFFPGARFFWVRDLDGFFAGDDMKAHEVGGAGDLAGAGDDAENVPGFQLATAEEMLLCDRDHLLCGMGLAAADGMNSPIEVHALNDG